MGANTVRSEAVTALAPPPPRGIVPLASHPVPLPAGLVTLFERPQFTLAPAEKSALLFDELRRLVEHHRVACAPYGRILRGLGGGSAVTVENLPALPVSLFKTHDLVSVPAEQVFKHMTSSGTTGQAVSRIALDRTTADLQTRALAAIMRVVLGPQRLPMLIVDHRGVVRDRTEFTARGAGVLGMLPFGRAHCYALDAQMRLDVPAVSAFLERHAGGPIVVFGFTFMVWQYLLQEVRERGLALDLSQAVLIHSGGWKKLADQAVDNAQFKAELAAATGLRRVHNFYGMVEQVGSVFLEGADGLLYAPNFAEVVVRDPETWEPVPDGNPGVIDVLSVLPRSYPGHILRTEDLGVIRGRGTGADGWTGTRFEVLGRVPRAEVRGCSDTHMRPEPQIAEVRP